MTTAAPAVEEVRFRGQPAITVSAGDLAATFLPALGMTGISLQCAGREHLARPGGLAALRSGSTLGLPLLAPWANRLARRRYTAAGVDVDLDGLALGCDGNGLPIHGVLVGQPGWRLGRPRTRADRASFGATLDVDTPAFPFPHRIELAVTARERRLTIGTTVVPTGSRAVPIAFGWHPYLQLPGTPRRRWCLRLPERAHLALDGRGIPTGGEQREADEAAPIGGRTFDDLYRLGRHRDLALVGDDVTISMRAGAGYPYAQVWVPRGRPFAALEPMTAATNSLVDGTVPLTAPGESYAAEFDLTIEGPT